MIHDESIRQNLSFLEKDLVDKIMQFSIVESFNSKTPLIREGQYLKHLPVVIDGMVKVYSQFDDRELLLYYIKPSQSCIISFAAATYNQPSQIFAITEVKSKILLIPTENISAWKALYPRFNQLFFDLYYTRYLDLLETINQLVFKKLDQRVITYLSEIANHSQSEFIKIQHHKIAKDLGTAREVVTRILKKLEKDEKIIQSDSGIKILKHGD